MVRKHDDTVTMQYQECGCVGGVFAVGCPQMPGWYGHGGQDANAANGLDRWRVGRGLGLHTWGSSQMRGVIQAGAAPSAIQARWTVEDARVIELGG